MGEYADDMIDGTCCQICGEFHPDIFEGSHDDVFESQGFPWTCPDCTREMDKPFRKVDKPNKIPCEQCGKRISPIGMKQHVEAKHKEEA